MSAGETGGGAGGGVAAGGPLAGRSVVVTRARSQAAGLVERLEALGAEVLALPLLEIADPPDWAPADRAIAGLAAYDWVVLSSANGVDRFLARLEELGVGSEALRGVRCAAVGSATAARMRERGLEVALVPEDFRAEGLVEAFRALPPERRRRVLIARALEAREVLPEALREMGCEVDVVATYQTVPVPPDPAVVARLRAGTADAVTLTSGAIASRFVRVLAEEGLDVDTVMDGLLVASIGPVTTEALRDLGYEADVEAGEATVESLVQTVVMGLGRKAR